MSSDSQLVLLIPAHNEADGTEEALSSVHAQTRMPDRKIIIADNCADDTVGVVCRFGRWGGVDDCGQRPHEGKSTEPGI